MNCQEFWNTMPELGGADAGAQSHLVDCPACAARLARQQEIAAGLRAMAASFGRVAAPSRVEARLRKAFRTEAGLTGRPLRPAFAPAFAWVLACAAVLALAFFVVRGRQPEVQIAATAVTSAEAQSDYEGFIPLPNAARLTDTEDVNVVRVEVPRSAMIAVGFEVSPERASELVAADVMLGPDGLARAVRFLDSEGTL